MNNIDQKVKQVIAQQLGLSISDIKPEQELVKDLGSDSLDLVEICMAIEDEFRIEIDDNDAAEITTVQQYIDYVTKVTTPA
jgi:acyl carrier protein